MYIIPAFLDILNHYLLHFTARIGAIRCSQDQQGIQVRERIARDSNSPTASRMVQQSEVLSIAVFRVPLRSNKEVLCTLMNCTHTFKVCIHLYLCEFQTVCIRNADTDEATSDYVAAYYVLGLSGKGARELSAHLEQ